MNTKIITTLADFINAYENYQDKVNDKKTMAKLDQVYKKILAAAEKYPDDYDRFNNHCIKNNLYRDFQQHTERLMSILLNHRD